MKFKSVFEWKHFISLPYSFNVWVEMIKKSLLKQYLCIISLAAWTVSLLLISSSTSFSTLSPRSIILALHQLSFPSFHLSKVKFPTVFPGHRLCNSRVLRLLSLVNMGGELLFMVAFSAFKQLNKYTKAHRDKGVSGRKNSHSLSQMHISSPDLVIPLAIKAEYLLNL